MRSLRGYGSILSAPNREMQAGMAQSVERHIGSVEVPGPIPGASSQKKADRSCGPSFVLPFCSVSLQGGRGSICFSAKQRAGLSPDLGTDLPAFCFLCFPSARPSPSLTPTSRCRTREASACEESVVSLPLPELPPAAFAMRMAASGRSLKTGPEGGL